MTDIFCCLARLLPNYTLINIFEGGTGFAVFILKEFQTCGVSSATDVAQLDRFILEISKIQLVVYYQCCVLTA